MAVPRRVLFLCTHNAARSQMAEALLRHLSGDRVEALSAGTIQTTLHPMAVQVMAEMGVDISAQQSKTLERYREASFDLVITVCDRARESCPIFPHAKRTLHWSLVDPARATENDLGQLRAFRKTRDELKQRILRLLPILFHE